MPPQIFSQPNTPPPSTEQAGGRGAMSTTVPVGSEEGSPSPAAIDKYGIDDLNLSINHRRLSSGVYSAGQTLSDVFESATVSATYDVRPLGDDRSPSSLSVIERGLSTKQSKHTLKLKGNAVDDGYRWRKYGKKFIKNSPNPRSYYKCSIPNCGAKKYVEKSNDDPGIHMVTYEGSHLHFAYPYLHFSGAHPGTQVMGQKHVQLPPPAETAQQTLGRAHQSPLNNGPNPVLQVGGIRAQGLLEDMVPTEVLNPTFFN